MILNHSKNSVFSLVQKIIYILRTIYLKSFFGSENYLYTTYYIFEIFHSLNKIRFMRKSKLLGITLKHPEFLT